MRKTGWQHDILLPKFLSNMYFSPGRCHINFVWHYVNPCKYYRKLVECRNGGFSRLLVATSFPISFRPMQGNPDSWICEIFACGIRNPTENWNSESKFHWQRIRNPVPGIRNPRRGIENPRLSSIPLCGANLSMTRPQELKRRGTRETSSYFWLHW